MRNMMFGVRCAKVINNQNIIQKCFYHKLRFWNFNDYFSSHYDKCNESVTIRNCNVNLDHLIQKYKKHSDLMMIITNLEKEKEDIVGQLTEVEELGESPIINEIKEKGRILRNQMHEFRFAENNLRNELLLSFKILPAFLDPNTPVEDKITYESAGVCTVGKNHLELCASQINLRSQSLEGKEPVVTAFLLDDLALLERSLYDKYLEHLKQLKTYRHLVHPDMVMQFVADACLEKNEMSLEILESSTGDRIEEQTATTLILTGSSLPGFLAYLSTMNLQSPTLPCKFYSLGRNYKAGGNIHHGLYDMSQTIQAELFSITSNQQTSQESYEEQKEFILNFYKTLELPFKMVESAATNLASNESRRTDYYVWSAGFNRYFKCGHLRSLDDHVSRKLSFFHKEDNSFFKMNHGVIFKLPTIMAALIEKEQTGRIISRENYSLS